MNDPLVSIIMPTFNAEKYILEAILSVIAQPFKNWELLIINDGSTDATEDVILKLPDPRIVYVKQENRGVSAARNTALSKMTGDFFCFLDADDSFPRDSLLSRIELFRNPSIDFVDGKVLRMNSDMTRINSEWRPHFHGKPLNDLVRLTGRSFLGLTWLIRRDKSKVYRFKEGLTHGEDLLFFMELARMGGDYSSVNEPVLHYRDTIGSAMKNLHGLENGYRFVEKEIQKWPELPMEDLTIFKLRWRKFMALDYIKRGKIKKAFGLLR